MSIAPSSPEYHSYDRGSRATAVSPYITASILVAGVAGGLVIVIAVILVCKYCVKRKYALSRAQAADSERASDRRLPLFQRYETINSDMFSEPSTGSVDAVPVSPRKPYELTSGSHDRSTGNGEADESTKLKSDFDKMSYHEADVPLETDDVTDVAEPQGNDVTDTTGRRVSFHLDNLPQTPPDYQHKGRRYTDGDFHYLKNIRIAKANNVPRQFSLGPRMLGSTTDGRAIEEFELHELAPAGEVTNKPTHCENSLIHPCPLLLESPSPTNGIYGPQIVNVEIHYKDAINTAICTNCVGSPRRLRDVEKCNDDVWDYDILKITEFSKGPYNTNDFDPITDTESLSSSKIRYNDMGSQEELNEDTLDMYSDFEYESIIPDNSDADTATLNGAEISRELWNLRTTLEEEEECSDTIRMEDMTSDEQPSDRELEYETYLSSPSRSQCVNTDQLQTNGRRTHSNGCAYTKFNFENVNMCSTSPNANFLHPNYENHHRDVKLSPHPCQRKKPAGAENSFDSVETADTDGDMSDTSRHEATTTSFESTTDNTDSTNDSQTSRLRQMKADSGYKSLETQQPPTNTNGTKKTHSMDDEIVLLESTHVVSSRDDKHRELVDESATVSRRSSLFEKRRSRTASKRRRAYSRDKPPDTRLHNSNHAETETDSARSDQPSGDSLEEPLTPNSKFSVFTRFFKFQRPYHYKGLSRDFSIDEHSNDIFQEFVRYDPQYDGQVSSGTCSNVSSGKQRQKLQRKYTDPGPGYFDEPTRHRLCPDVRSTSMGSESSASSAARRISPGDSIEEEFEELEEDIDAAVANHKHRLLEQDTPIHAQTPTLSIHEIPIIKLPEGESIDMLQSTIV